MEIDRFAILCLLVKDMAHHDTGFTHKNANEAPHMSSHMQDARGTHNLLGKVITKVRYIEYMARRFSLIPPLLTVHHKDAVTEEVS